MELPRSHPPITPDRQKLRGRILIGSIFAIIGLWVFFGYPYSLDGTALVVKMQKLGCFGECPFYTVTVYGSGLTVFEGDLYVDQEGQHFGMTSQRGIQKIIAAIQQADYFTLDKVYGCGSIGLDAPHTLLDITLKRKNKDLILVHDCYPEEDFVPQELLSLEETIEEETNVQQWIGNKGQ